jgi:hypothetical protein
MSYPIILCSYAPMQCFLNALAYFDSDVSYVCKMIMKLTPGGNIKKLFSFIIDENSK